MGDAYLREHPNPNLRQYRSPRREQPSGVIALHTAENTPDYVAFDGGAEAVARFISTRKDPGSYHELVDSDSYINLVRWEDEAWHDGTGTNPHSFGLSFATRADVWALAPARWRKGAISLAAQRAAAYAAWIKRKHGIVIPARLITAEEARRRVPGFVTHARLDPRRRTDPGATFPYTTFLGEFAALTATPPPPPPEPTPLEAHMGLAYRFSDGRVWLCTATHREHLRGEEALNKRAIVGLVSPVPEDDPNRDEKHPMWVRKANRDAEAILSELAVVGE